MVNELELLFPGLRGTAYGVTSPPDRKYNCIAWAAGDTRRWWWPDPPPDDEGYHWPPGVSNEETVAAFIAVFVTLGYEPCDETAVELGWERVALYATADGVPTHAARQLHLRQQLLVAEQFQLFCAIINGRGVGGIAVSRKSSPRSGNMLLEFALSSTLLFLIMFLPLSVVVPLFLALLVNIPLRGIQGFRMAYYLPVITSWGKKLTRATFTSSPVAARSRSAWRISGRFASSCEGTPTASG